MMQIGQEQPMRMFFMCRVVQVGECQVGVSVCEQDDEVAMVVMISGEVGE
jgi:hypothetical protein